MMILFFLPEKSTGFFLLAGIIVLGIMIIYYCLLPSALPCYLELPACSRKKEKINGSFWVSNEKRIPIFCGMAKGTVKNIMTGEELPLYLDIGLLGREEGEAPFTLFPKTMGIYEVRVDDIEVFGLFGIGRKKASPGIRKECMVLPLTTELSFEADKGLLLGEEGEKVFYSGQGKDPSLYQGIRPYREGDRMKQIHWKVTGKTGEYMVKEMAEPANERVLLLLDTTLDGFDSGKIDTLAEAWLSVSQRLAEQNYPHTLGWRNPSEGSWHDHRVSTLSELDEVFPGILRCSFDASDTTPEEYPVFSEEWRKYGAVILVTGRAGRIKQWEELFLKEGLWDGGVSGRKHLSILVEKERKDKEYDFDSHCISFTETTMKRDLNRITL